MQNADANASSVLENHTHADLSASVSPQKETFQKRLKHLYYRSQPRRPTRSIYTPAKRARASSTNAHPVQEQNAKFLSTNMRSARTTANNPNGDVSSGSPIMNNARGQNPHDSTNESTKPATAMDNKNKSTLAKSQRPDAAAMPNGIAQRTESNATNLRKSHQANGFSFNHSSTNKSNASQSASPLQSSHQSHAHQLHCNTNANVTDSLPNGVTNNSNNARPSLSKGSPRRRARERASTLWEQLVAAQQQIDSEPRVDPRFVSGRRPLDCLSSLSTTLAVTLFPNGFVRHEPSAIACLEHAPTNLPAALSTSRSLSSPNKAGSVSLGARQPNIASQQRLPYDRASKDFLTALDLGLIPPEEDLPDPEHRHYYDGCLVAEVHDFRSLPPFAFDDPPAAWRKNGLHSRILLRPDVYTYLSDIEHITRDVDEDVALLVEQRLLLAMNPRLRLDPQPCVERYFKHMDARSSVSQLNIARNTRGRRVTTDFRRAPVPSLSSAALMLIAGAEKQQSKSRSSQLGERVVGNASSMAPIPTLSSGVSGGAARTAPNVHSAFPSVSVGQNPSAMQTTGPEHDLSRSRTLTASSPSVSAKSPGGVSANERRHIHPPPIIFSTQRPDPAAAPGKQGAGNTIGVRNQQERLRSIQLLLPHRNVALLLQRLQSMSAGGGEAEKRALQQVVANISKNGGQQLCILDLVRRPGRGCELLIWRGVAADKARDMTKVPLGNVDDATKFLNQFKAIMKKEGYYCLYDGTPQSGGSISASHQQAKRRAGSESQQQPQSQQAPGLASAEQQGQQLQRQQGLRQQQVQRQQGATMRPNSLPGGLHRPVQAPPQGQHLQHAQQRASRQQGPSQSQTQPQQPPQQPQTQPQPVPSQQPQPQQPQQPQQRQPMMPRQQPRRQFYLEQMIQNQPQRREKPVGQNPHGIGSALGAGNPSQLAFSQQLAAGLGQPKSPGLPQNVGVNGSLPISGGQLLRGSVPGSMSTLGNQGLSSAQMHQLQMRQLQQQQQMRDAGRNMLATSAQATYLPMNALAQRNATLGGRPGAGGAAAQQRTSQGVPQGVPPGLAPSSIGIDMGVLTQQRLQQFKQPRENSEASAKAAASSRSSKR